MTDRRRGWIVLGVLLVALVGVGALGVSLDGPWTAGTGERDTARDGGDTDPPAWTFAVSNESRCGDRCLGVTLSVTNTGATATNVTVDVTLRPEGRPTPVWGETFGVGPVATDGVASRRATVGFGPLGLTRLQEGNCTVTADVTVRWNGPESPHRTSATIDNVCETLFVR